MNYIYKRRICNIWKSK